MSSAVDVVATLVVGWIEGRIECHRDEACSRNAAWFDRRQSRPALRRHEAAAVCAGLPESALFLKRPDVVVNFDRRFCVEQREILIICDVRAWASRSSAEVLKHPVDLSLVRPRPSAKPASK
jgi:hypothetical protein